MINWFNGEETLRTSFIHAPKDTKLPTFGAMAKCPIFTKILSTDAKTA
jgi:hypothetical protein